MIRQLNSDNIKIKKSVIHLMSKYKGINEMTYEKYYQCGQELYVQGKYAQALVQFKKCNKLKQSNDCLNYIGCCYLMMNDLCFATRIFKKLILTCPNWERPLFNLGRVYLKLKNFEDALQCFENAIVINPQNEDAFYYLGVYYFEVGNYEKAKMNYEKSIRLNYNSSETHLNLGMCNLRLKKYKEALQEFEIAYELDNNCINAVYDKGMVFINQGKYKEAVDTLLLVYKQIPEDLDVMMDIAHCYYKLEDYESAHVWVKNLLEIEPQHDLANKLLKRLSSLM